MSEDEDVPPWELAERALTAGALNDEANFDRQMGRFAPVVLREGVADEDVAFYHASVWADASHGVLERFRSDAALQAKAAGMGEPKVTEPRAEILSKTAAVVAVARDRCLRDGAAMSNVEMYERLIAWRRLVEVVNLADLAAIDTAKAAGAGTDW